MIEKNFHTTKVRDEMVAFLPHMDQKYLNAIQKLPSLYHVRNIGKLCLCSVCGMIILKQSNLLHILLKATNRQDIYV